MDTFESPDIVVGVDFGMTCTGVAYSLAPEWPQPLTIQHWPGMVGHEIRNKVATAVAYDISTQQPVTFGFAIDKDNMNLDIQRLFKLNLDPAYKDCFPHQPSLAEARKWFKDYLSFVYRAIRTHFDETLPRWTSSRVEFQFSVPTTWKSPAMIHETESLIRQAGFGENPKHTAKITLTEAEAAAVYSSRSYEKDDVLLVCDAGGGTTDVNILKVTSTAFGRIQLKQLSWVEGEAIGSTLLDFQVEEMIRQRLEGVRQYLTEDPSVLAERMITDKFGRFENFKCSFGAESINVLNLFLPIPGVPTGMDFPHLSIQNSSLVIKKEELQAVFDQQVEKIFAFLDRELQKLQVMHPNEVVNYMVMSGGLGGSPYLRQRLKKRYELGGVNLPNAHGVRILSTLEPQLAVVHGLVMARSQELKNNVVVFVERCCPNSYGVVVRQPYNPLLHLGEPVVVDPRDGKKWAEKQIDWLVKQGQTVSAIEGIKHRYRLKIDMGKEALPWRTTLVMSSLPSSQLPRSMRSDGVKALCSVESLLNATDMKLKNRHWYNLKPCYHRAEFEMRIIVGSANLKFQLWGRNGQLSKDHEQIEVQWASGGLDSPKLEVEKRDVFGMWKV